VPHWFGSTGNQSADVLSLFGEQGERMHVRATSGQRQRAEAASRRARRRHASARTPPGSDPAQRRPDSSSGRHQRHPDSAPGQLRCLRGEPEAEAPGATVPRPTPPGREVTDARFLEGGDQVIAGRPGLVSDRIEIKVVRRTCQDHLVSRAG
jgi:hypothetical protein